MSDMDTPEVLQKALDKATAGGWKSTRRERCDLWDNEQQCWYEQEDRQHVYEIIFSDDFAKALWGTDQVDNNGVSIKTIQYWATQVAVKHLGKLHAVEDNKPVVSIYDMPDVDFSKPPEELVEGTRTQYRLQKMAGSIPFETHRIKEVNVYADSLPAYLYHLQQMVIDPDPIGYLERHIDG